MNVFYGFENIRIKIKKGSLFLFLFLLFGSTFLNAQVNKNGIPFITNYSSKIYNGAEQNWAVVQDKRGVMYFGNNDNGLLEYDGVTWRKIPVKNSSIVRSLTIDSNGVVYVGTVNDFGYLSTDSKGNIEYKSLFELVDTTKSVFADIWKSYYSDNGAYFCCEGYIFNYKNSKLKQIEIPNGVVFSFLINNSLYLPNITDGLLTLKDTTSELVENGNFYISKGVYTMNYFKDKILIGASPGGFFYYDKETGKSTKAFKNEDVNKFINTHNLYQSFVWDSSHLFFGTIFNGVILANDEGKIINHYNKANGLQDETITGFYKDKQENLWLSLNNGVSKIEQGLPFKRFSEQQGIKGYITSICEFENKLFIATSVGVFYRELKSKQTPEFVQLTEIKSQTWSLLNYDYKGKKQLLIGTISGLYTLDENLKVKFIDKQIMNSDKETGTNYVQKLYRSKAAPEKVIVGVYNGAFSISFDGKKWHKDEMFKINNDIRHIYEDEEGNIWFATFMNGLAKSKKGSYEDIVFYGLEEGVPDINQPFVSTIDKKVSIGTKQGIFTLNKETDKFERDTNFGNFNKSSYFFTQDHLGNVWVSAYDEEKRSVTKFIKDEKGKFFKDEAIFNRLPNEQADMVYNTQSGLTWIGTSSGLYCFDNSSTYNKNTAYNCLVRRVIANNDSIVFNGTYRKELDDGTIVPSLLQNKDKIPELTYRFNNFVFEFASTWFIQESRTQYSYQLQGNSEEWSKWSKETKAVFTNLNEGEYTFKVRAKNIFGVESTMGEFSFIIKPPFYRSILAYIFYVIAGIFILIGIIKVYTRRLEQEKIRLEEIVEQRTSEIREQNVVLQDQKEEILKQKEEITSSIQYALRIQRAIVPSEEDAKEKLKNYFLLWKPRDIVSGDFWWMGEKEHYVVVTAADCTGHGVPGAFMSMLGVSFLNEIVNQQSIIHSGEILDRLRDKVKNTLGQTTEANSNKDGMDIALLVLDFKNMKAQFSGAYNPLYLYRNGELLETKATRNPIGIYIKEKNFEQTEIELQKGDTLYLFSDGFPDQFGGDRGKKYSTKRFKEFLLNIQENTMEEQRELLNQEIEQWRGKTDQIDDIIVLGIRI